MSVNIPTHYAQEFATNIQLLLQQQGSRLRDKVMSDTHVGKQASPVDQIGLVEMQEVTGRFGSMGRIDAPTARRWVLPTDYDLPQLLDSFDELRLLTDPKSSYVQNAVSAAGRQFDRLIIAAFFAAATTGETASGSTAHGAGQAIAVDFGASGNVGATVAKLREAKRLLMAADVDLDVEEVHGALTAKQHDDLLKEAQIISLDYNDKPVLVEGRIVRFLGINFTHTELLATDANSYRRMPIWVKSGMHLGLWNDITTDISQRKDLQGLPFQAYVYMTAGSTRVEEEKVVEIRCSEA
jgi:hypothetical protein